MDRPLDQQDAEMAPEMGDMLPEEIEQLEELKRQARIDRIEALATSIAKKRDDAVKHRQQSGIEDEWTEDEEAYQGIDDANRGADRGEPGVTVPVHGPYSCPFGPAFNIGPSGCEGRRALG